MYADAYDACLRRAATSGALCVHAYDQPEVIAGQGTLRSELMTQADVDTVLVAVGGGGLAAGVRVRLCSAAPIPRSAVNGWPSSSAARTPIRQIWWARGTWLADRRRQVKHP